MLAFVAAVALAQSPLRVTAVPIALPNADLLTDTAPADGVPDGWVTVAEKGGLSATAGKEPGSTTLSWKPGSKGSLCSSQVSVPEGSTLHLRGRVKGSNLLEDITAVHLHIGGARGELHVARRRFDTGAFPWEDLSITATVPPGGSTAYVCYEVQMQRPEAMGSLTLAPLTLEAVTAESRSAALPIRRIVVVSVEAFRYDHVHAYGYPRPTTPNLDALISEGVSFDRHYAPAPYTHPSLASLVTGQSPTALGFVDNIPTLGANVPTAADLLAQAGYVTAAFNVQYVLSNRYGLNKGFHYYRNHPNDTPANVLNDELLPFLTAHQADNLFLWVHYFDPHGPYRPPARFKTLFSGDPLWGADTAKLTAGEQAEGAAAIPRYIYDNGKLERRHYVANYDGDIAFTDSEIGRLVDYLRLTDRDDTLVLLTADHGESMTDHDRYFCHGSLYDHDLHVPMVAWGPGIVTAGGRVGGLSSHIDVLPTLLDYAGAGNLPGFAGRSLRPELEGRTGPARDWVTSVVGRSENLRYAVHAPDGLKLITDLHGNLQQAWSLATDPNELAELSGKDRKPAKDLARRFAGWLMGKPVAPAKKPQLLDKEDEERLRALGYLE